MLLPIDWLKEFVQTDKSPEEIGDIFHNIGFSLDGISRNILDLEITPNRGDAVSVYGLARELKAKMGNKIDKYYDSIEADKKTSDYVTFSDRAKGVVPRYAYIIARDGKIGESDNTIKNRLKEIEINPKNNLVDLTNYLMHESGQPLHVFDLDKISNLKIDFASEEEKATLLGDIDITLTEENLVAYCDNKIVDLVGISGCRNSAVSENTKNILVQAAIFDPPTIRRSSKSVHVSTPASYRYERGTDCNMPLQVLNKFADYLKKWGYKVTESVDINNSKYSPKEININYDLIDNISGIHVGKKDVNTILENLGFAINNGKVIVPSWREGDIKLEIDLVEEVIKIIGYDKITPVAIDINDTKGDSTELFENYYSYFADLGFTETLNYSFISPSEAKALNYPVENLVEVSQPLSRNNQYLRPSLKAKLAKTISSNPWYSQVDVFEIGHVFTNTEEKINIGFASTSKNNRFQKYFKPEEIETILPDSDFGQFLKLKRKCYYAETEISNIKIPKILKAKLTDKEYKPISKFPPVVRDIVFLINRNVDITDVAMDIQDSNGAILLCEPFDEFYKAEFNNKKSVGLRITYQAMDHTLDAQEAENIHSKTVDYIKEKYGSTIR